MVELLDFAILLSSLIVILLSCEVFVNGIEQLGCKLRLSEGATGSVLAAVGTATPETIIPLIAIFLGTAEGEKIGIGAILGAPFMLATLAMFFGGITVLIAHSKQGRSVDLNFSAVHVKKDLSFFLAMYFLALISTQFNHVIKPAVAGILIGVYVYYLRMVWREGGEIDSESCAPLYLAKLFRGSSSSTALIAAQVLGSLLGIILGAKIFVGAVESISAAIGISPFILAFIIAPVATELPEKFNSVMWYWRGKDALAMGNVTGAMVFQSSIPVSIGILFTPWQLGIAEALSVLLALLGALILYLSLRFSGKISAKLLLMGGFLYFIYIFFIILR